VPALFRLLNSSNLKKEHFKALQYVMLSGERINPPELVDWYRTFGDRIQLVNFYGPTETTMIKAWYPIERSDVNRERIPIGKAVKGARIFVLDTEMKVCDELEQGEIYIRTPFRTFGYYNEPGLNKERFIQNPFNNQPDDILYKTGDLGKLLPDGDIEFLGRRDRQVKLRGIRIELEEIEGLLLKHPRVKQAVVTKEEKEFLCAFITGNGAPPDDDGSLPVDLKEHLTNTVPEYMVPARIEIIKEIPLKPNGKIDYDGLSDLLKEEDEGYVPAGNDREKRLQQLWMEILGVERISMDRSFFEVGGNSLNVMALLSKIHRDFDVRIPLGQIFDNVTIEKQARLIKESKEETCHSIEAAPEKEYYVLSSGQKRLFTVNRMDAESTAYNIPLTVVLEGALDRVRLEMTFRGLIRRHESFRTSFEVIDGEILQKIHKEVEFEIRYYDLATEYSGGKIHYSFIRPFDLSRAPLLRAALIKEEDKKHILMVDMHHIVTDGVSQGILMRDFMSLYRGEALPNLCIRYKDYAEWQNREKESERMKQQEAYWLNEFSGEIPPPDLPVDFVDFPGTGLQGFEGHTVRFELGVKETNVLQQIVQREGGTMFMLLLALFNILLAKIIGQEDIVVGTPVSGRSHADLEQVIGMFVNMLALRNYPAKEKTFTDFREEVKKKTIKAFENQDYPFEELVEKLELTKNKDTHPLFRAMFELQNIKIPPINIPGLALKTRELENRVSGFDLILTAVEPKSAEASGKLLFTFEYRTKLFKQEKIQRFVDYFKEIVEQVVGNRELKLKEISISHDFVEIEPENMEEIQGDFGF